MDYISVKNLTFNSKIVGNTIIVSIYADGTLIGNKEFTTINYTISSAEESILSEFNMFGLFINNKMYKKEEIPEPPEPTDDTELPPKDISNKNNIKNNNKKLKRQETIIDKVQNTNIEDSEKVSNTTKKEISKTTEKNDKSVQESKPKLIIKIPKPFGKGYIIIELSKMLGGLISGLSAGIVATLLSKISTKLTDSINNNEITQDDINNELNKMNFNDLINESKLEYNNNEINTVIDIDDKIDDKIDKYNKTNKNKRNIKKKYTIDKRNRKDILESEKVKEREMGKNSNKIVKNPNYGIYID